METAHGERIPRPLLCVLCLVGSECMCHGESCAPMNPRRWLDSVTSSDFLGWNVHRWNYLEPKRAERERDSAVSQLLSVCISSFQCLGFKAKQEWRDPRGMLGPFYAYDQGTPGPASQIRVLAGFHHSLHKPSPRSSSAIPVLKACPKLQPKWGHILKQGSGVSIQLPGCYWWDFIIGNGAVCTSQGSQHDLMNNEQVRPVQNTPMPTQDLFSCQLSRDLLNPSQMSLDSTQTPSCSMWVQHELAAGAGRSGASIPEDSRGHWIWSRAPGQLPAAQSQEVSTQDTADFPPLPKRRQLWALCWSPRQGCRGEGTDLVPSALPLPAPADTAGGGGWKLPAYPQR